MLKCDEIYCIFDLFCLVFFTSLCRSESSLFLGESLVHCGIVWNIKVDKRKQLFFLSCSKSSQKIELASLAKILRQINKTTVIYTSNRTRFPHSPEPSSVIQSIESAIRVRETERESGRRELQRIKFM